MKKALIVAVLLILLGSGIFGIVMIKTDNDLSKLSTIEYETNSYYVEQEFSNIDINTPLSDVTFILTEEEQPKIVCVENEKIKHDVKVVDGTLWISENDERELMDYLNPFSNENPSVVVYLSSQCYSELKIKTTTGDVIIPSSFAFASVDISTSTGDVDYCAETNGRLNISVGTGDITLKDIGAEEIVLKVSTGKVAVETVTCNGLLSMECTTGRTNLKNVICKRLFSKGSTGDIALQDVIVDGTMDIERSTGDVTFERCDGRELSVETSTGDVTGTLLSAKKFYTYSETGKITVPDTHTGGECRITTSTGKIKIQIP